MNHKLYRLLILCILILHSGWVSAQCAAGRYLTTIFPAYTMDSVVYSTMYNLKMDIYQPVGDTISARPLIILAHGGSFIDGNREDDTAILKLCQNFAMRGYVTASIDYRLDDSFATIFDSVVALNELVYAISDGKAAVRFFRDSVNRAVYRIDTNNIFAGGNSAGAVLYMHVGYLDSLSQCTPDLSAAFSANGGFEGNSGYPGLSSRPRAVISLAGALHSVDFASPGNIPSVNAQGDNDQIVPFDCGYQNLGWDVPLLLCGLGELQAKYTASGIYNMSTVFHGAGSAPWSSDISTFNTVDSLTTQFLYTLVCQVTPAGVTNVQVPLETNLFPNPASELVTISSSISIIQVSVFDNTGRVITLTDNINNRNYELNTSSLSPGIYFVKIRFSDENNPPVVKKIVIE